MKAKSSNLDELVGELSYNKDRIAVELNGKIIKKQNYSDTLLSDEDKIEIVAFVGGG